VRGGGQCRGGDVEARGFQGRVILITAESDIPYDRPSLSKTFLEGDVDPADLALRSEDFYKERGIRLLTGRRVTSLDIARAGYYSPKGNPSHSTSSSGHRGIPRRPEIPGTDLRGVLPAAEPGRREGDPRGTEKSEARRDHGCRIHRHGSGSLAPKARPPGARGRARQCSVAKVFGDRVGTWLRGLHAKQGVRFHLGKTVTEVRGTEGWRRLSCRTAGVS